MNDVLTNVPLWTSLLAIVLAQFIKIPLHFASTKVWQWSLMFSTGGMPSSHSAAVTALSTSIGIQDGLNSSTFAISAIIGVIVMFDAAGVRRHAGMQAVVLNKLVDDVHKLLADMKFKPRNEQAKKLKELLGHQPIEVIMGGTLGVLVAAIVYAW